MFCCGIIIIDFSNVHQFHFTGTVKITRLIQFRQKMFAYFCGLGPLLLKWLNFYPSIVITCPVSVGWYYLSVPKLQRCNRNRYNGCNYLSVLGLKLFHVNKRDVAALYTRHPVELLDGPLPHVSSCRIRAYCSTIYPSCNSVQSSLSRIFGYILKRCIPLIIIFYGVTIDRPYHYRGSFVSILS